MSGSSKQRQPLAPQLRHVPAHGGPEGPRNPDQSFTGGMNFKSDYARVLAISLIVHEPVEIGESGAARSFQQDKGRLSWDGRSCLCPILRL